MPMHRTNKGTRGLVARQDETPWFVALRRHNRRRDALAKQARKNARRLAKAKR